jgi:ribosomal protein L4
MRLITVSEIEPFGERQTGIQRQKGMPMPSWLNGETVSCPIKPNSVWRRTVDKVILIITGGCYE